VRIGVKDLDRSLEIAYFSAVEISLLVGFMQR
jgi:hypothetical protein